MKIAIYQMLIKDNMKDNFEKMKKAIITAAEKDVELIVFPECCLTGYLGITLKSINDVKMDEVCSYLKKIASLAKEQKIAVVTGQYIIRCGKWYNNLIFIDDEGICLTSYDKNHLIDEDCYYIAPGTIPKVFEYKNIKFMLGICHDIRYAEHTMWGCDNGVQVYINAFYGIRGAIGCSKFQNEYNAILKTRAIENGIYILAPNVANDEQMVRSQVLNPQGDMISVAKEYGEEILICDLDHKLSGNGRRDLYLLKANSPLQNFFESGYWDTKPTNTVHDRRWLKNDNIHEI